MTGVRRVDDADVGQEMAEREMSVAECEWERYDKERAAINRDFGSRLIAADNSNRLELELEYSLAIVECQKHKPTMPRPAHVQRQYPRLALVGRGPYRPGPLSDG